MRVAIAGTGFAASIHGRMLRELGHEVVAVVGSNPSNTETLARSLGARKWGHDYGIAIADCVDSVHICTPPALHYEMARAAIENGKSVVCEKPLCFDNIEAEALFRLSAQKGVVCAVDFNVRFYESCSRARKIIASSSFGEVLLVHGAYLQEFHILPDGFSWRYRPELAGPMRAVTEIGSHWIDLARYLTGLEITSVFADFGAFSEKRYLSDGIMSYEGGPMSEEISVTSEDAATILFRFSNGAKGCVVVSEISHGRRNRLAIEITGRHESVWWNSESPGELNRGRKREEIARDLDPFSGAFADTFKSLFREFYADVARGKASAEPAYPTFRDGYINTRVCSAMLDSSSQSRWVDV